MADGTLFVLARGIAFNLGETVPGAQLFFYSAATGSKQNTYTTESLTVAHSNPIDADAYGKLPAIFLDPSLDDYKYVLTTADDSDPPLAPFETVDNYPGVSGRYPATDAEDTAVVTVVDPSIPSHEIIGYFMPERYCVNTTPGTTIMQTGFANATAVAVAAGGGTIWASTHYKMSGPLPGALEVNIAGPGWLDFSATTGHGITLDWTSDFSSTTYEDFKITGPASGNFNALYQAGTLNDADILSGLKIRNLRVSGWNVGLKLRTARNVEVVGNWFQNVDRGCEFAGACIVSQFERNHVIKGAGGGGSGSSIGVTFTSFNYTSGSGIVYCEGQQFISNEVFGFDTAILAAAVNYLNISAGNDIEAKIIGLDVSTVQFVLNFEGYIQLDGAAAQYGVILRALGAPLAITKINIENFSIRATSLVTGSIGIKIEDGQKNYTIRDGIIDGFHTNDVLVSTSRAGKIDNITCQSTNPTNSIEVLSVTAGPVKIEDNVCTKLIGYTAADVASGKMIIGPNTISATSKIGSRLYGSATYDPPSLVDGTGTSTNVTVTGAALGDTVVGKSFSNDTLGITITAEVTAADTVSFRFQNETTSTLDLPSGTLRAIVQQRTSS